MKIDDIDSPGLVPNNHRLRQEVIRAISFAETLQSSEKAVELQAFFRQAIAYLDREIVSKDLPETGGVSLDPNAQSPFSEGTGGPVQTHYQPLLPPTAPKRVVGKPAIRGKK